MKTPPNNRGFTLLELTCAIFVISVAGFGALQMYSIGMSKILMMREYDAATEVLRNEVELIRAQPFAEIQSRESFDTATEVLDTLYQAETTVTVTGGDVAGLKEVRVSLQWRSREGRVVSRSLTTLVADKAAGGTS